MRDSSLRRVFALVVTLSLTVLGARGIPQAIAADCGTGVGPCQCGDRVVTNTRLSAADPVLRTACPCEGLIVASGVSLEIRGTMTGADDTCSAITLEGNATDVVVRNGRLTGFGVGINGDSLGAVSGNRFADLQIQGGFAGVLLTGDDNLVERVMSRDAFVAASCWATATRALNRWKGRPVQSDRGRRRETHLRNVAQRTADGIAMGDTSSGRQSV
jgi:hypothetical protein